MPVSNTPLFAAKEKIDPINVADEIKNSKLIQEEQQMVELHNGCICCTLRGDLLRTVRRLSEEAKFDYLGE